MVPVGAEPHYGIYEAIRATGATAPLLRTLIRRDELPSRDDTVALVRAEHNTL